MSIAPKPSRSADPTWYGAPEPQNRTYGATDWIRIVRRGLPLGITVFGGLAILLAMRLVERPLCGMQRPVTPWITRGVCTAAFWWLGIGRRVQGRPMTGLGVAVANHSTWLDIFALNASDSLYFVAKSEVSGWPGIGWLARATGTLFIRRDPRDAPNQARLLSDRLHAGHRLLFFPEGTSTDGLRVLPFKPMLFAPVFDEGIRSDAQVQAITVKYQAATTEPPGFYGWWGDMSYGANLLKILAAPRQGQVDVIYHGPLKAVSFSDRKALAKAAEALVRSGLES